MSNFEDWIENEAPQDAIAAKWINNANSSNSIVNIISRIFLFLIYMRSPFKSEATEVEPTTNITRKILADMNSQQSPHMSFPTTQEAQREDIPTSSTINVSEQTNGSKKIEVENKEVPALQQTLEHQPASVSSNTSSQSETAKLFLKQMEKAMKVRDKDIEEDIRRVRYQESIVFWGLVITATITLVIIVVGILLIFFRNLTVGIVVSVAGILPGTGTVILNKLSKGISERIKQLSKIRDENLKLLQAIQMALMIPDPKQRNDAMVSLSEKLREIALRP